jgi:hypothetical protein
MRSDRIQRISCGLLPSYPCRVSFALPFLLWALSDDHVMHAHFISLASKCHSLYSCQESYLKYFSQSYPITGGVGHRNG